MFARLFIVFCGYTYQQCSPTAFWRFDTHLFQLFNDTAVQILIQIPILDGILRRLGSTGNTGIEIGEQLRKSHSNLKGIHPPALMIAVSTLNNRDL